MHYGPPDAQGGQRSSFSRFMATRRASEGPASNPPKTGVEAMSSSLRLPTIAKGVGATPVSTSFSYSVQAHRNSRNSNIDSAPTERQGGALSPSAPAISTQVITERTPRAELLAAIVQLQADLSQRTDSVNAIQRNFQRLSAMHRAEQEELQRLRSLHQAGQDARLQETSEALAEQQRLVEQLRDKLKQQEEECALLKGEVADAAEQRRLALLHNMEDAYLRERQCIAYLEAEEHMELVRTAAAEQARCKAECETNGDHREQHAHILTLLREHTARLNVFRGGMRGGLAEAVLNANRPRNTEARSSMLGSEEEEAAVVVELQRAEETVKECVAARDAAAAQRHAAVSTAARQQIGELSTAMCSLQQAFRQALISCEREERQALAGAAAETAELLLQSFRQVTETAGHRVQYVAEARAQLEHTRAQCSERIDHWMVPAEERIHDLQQLIDAWRINYEGDLAAQRNVLLEHMQEARELAAARSEWVALQDTERKAHRAELAHMRQDNAAKTATVESRLKASQHQCIALQQALEEARATHQREMEIAATQLQAKGEESAAEMELQLSRQRARIQSAQEQNGQRVVKLLLDMSSIRGACCQAEAEARMMLYQACVQGAVRLFQSAKSTETLAEVVRAVCGTRAVHLTEMEAAARLQVEAEAQAEFVALASNEEGERQRLDHIDQLVQLHREVDNARAHAEAIDAQHRNRQVQLETDLRLAQEERHAALNKAADATTAAHDARDAEQIAKQQLLALKSSTAAAAQRIEAAENATESACCCLICLQLLRNPVACVPCGHLFCAGCLLGHTRNKALSALTVSASASPQLSRRESGAAAARPEVEVTQWMRSLIVPHTRLYCPECATASVSSLVELRALGELADKYTYKKVALLELTRVLS
ncbi:hypothetical protein ABL78_3357 [Leptomonas seymouri]|uniref:RING-type domain-containing protein n=1 Tax=Leptomonas seymouri TaxID=5684 RepID=A0A0N1I6A4_LEPSE|nr:hypothetical protein ABL78_3357 [Leptomonas seymouri]|eukprot:KPI87560.1 hypothetical protein ABL78_3357 [Leptomonas seymouri]